MKFYFVLQFRRFQRKCVEIGIPFFLAPFLLLLAFIGMSMFLFYKTQYAAFVYAGIAALSLIQLGDRNRIEQINRVFNKQTTNKIRLVENGLIILPFLFFLSFQSEFLIATCIIPLAIAFAFFNSGVQFSFSIPTPFKKFPFEFIIGFRKTFWLLGILYLIIIQAIHVDNVNLGIVCFGFLFLIGMSYYFRPEENYFVWIFKKSPAQFLKKKIIDGLICVSIVSLPALITLLIFYPGSWYFLIGIQCLGYLFLSSMILAKYSAFPKEMSVPQAILYGLSLWFPPLLLIIIPIFYRQSKRKLEPIL